jgi:hypothetical protein
MFKPSGFFKISTWIFISFLYSGIMYLLGESIIISAIILGILVTISIIFGEVSFTSIFTYKDLKNWVEQDKLKIERERIKESQARRDQELVDKCTKEGE